MNAVAEVTEKVENIKVGRTLIAMLSINIALIFLWHIERRVYSNSFE